METKRKSQDIYTQTRIKCEKIQVRKILVEEQWVEVERNIENSHLPSHDTLRLKNEMPFRNRQRRT